MSRFEIRSRVFLVNLLDSLLLEQSRTFANIYHGSLCVRSDQFVVKALAGVKFCAVFGRGR